MFYLHTHLIYDTLLINYHDNSTLYCISQCRDFNIVQVYQYFIYRRYFLSKVEQFSWISSYTTLFKILNQ